MVEAENPYIPKPAVIEKVIPETEGERAIKTFRVRPIDGEFNFVPGQTLMVSAFGKGESMFAISTSPTRNSIEFTVMRVGRVTTALHQMKKGDIVGIRGPLGNGFPVEGWEGKNVVLIGGGIGFAPLRSILHYILDNREKYGKLIVINGARTSRDLVYLNELERLMDSEDVWLSVDRDEEGWFKLNWDKPDESEIPEGVRKLVGFVPMVVAAVKPSPDNSVAVTCGPPIMIKYVIENLLKLGFREEQIYTTLENKMKCGIGKCGRCNIGSVYVCKDGPVFRYDFIKQLPPDF
ncbi:FAD/NAD(P)-binding protein [Archaeoglobus veneficus]|uniref:Dihydroorotate dehydrogenase, electron transfer subunit, iron-sulfur cluster binding domain protein n=1 Tax=Archaeoglobus veneficus (strain DSM 11195 / SNP6) TaxID=693661 RepID=F2KSM4_ARCVS|nr:FAD/NAD(P)-binding protein [Archaeoglobus veneficus]AEA48094.1 Dihydroorotate dehydrogenase, electron transfer subunit, iron-sulfur cluster binding domain protein [Archaeoglobus veneficus SNP6]